VREYRVVFEHCRHRTKFEVAVHALNIDDALQAATTVLESQLDVKAGVGEDWTHKETMEVDG